MYLFTIEYGFAKTKTILADGYETSLLTDSVTLWRLENGEKKPVATFRGVTAIWGEEPTASEVAPVQQENFWDTHDPSGGDLPPEDPKPEKKNSISRKKVDVEKVWALRKAGWTVPKISEEMKISPAYVFKICKEMKEKGGGQE